MPVATRLPCRPLLGLLLPLTMAQAMAQGIAEPLEILVEDAAEPFSRADGSGYANELVVAAYAAVGIDVKLGVVPYSRCKAMVLDGSVAACFNMAWEKALEGRVKLADEPLYKAHGVYFQHKARPLAARKESELGKPLRIGTVKDYEYADSALQARLRGAVFFPGRSEQVSLKRLAQGKLDAALVIGNDLQGSRYWAESAGVADQVELAFPSTPTLVYIGFSTSHPQGQWALDKFNQGYKLLRETGYIGQLRKKWVAQLSLH
ncbi:ABC transporter substrate-binding protein [Chitinibacter sp. GC72]|uniref:substrate-binding periplasmic protein n=1 Tax=Chitinibacter sp. GC72 TaxID=1526917 RepID=UPI0012F75E85|nr:transporter substrate-binding domain-containing protein [Chitinibacter sp. GC72]